MSALTPLEQALFKVISLEDFASACRNAFSGQSGVTLRSALCSVAHPFFPPVGKDALETYRQIGRSEIVTLLLRYSEPEATPSILIQSYASETKRPAKSRSRRTASKGEWRPEGADPGTNPALPANDDPSGG